ncbi:MAG TPA: tRNA (N(6)-L-threonylcarbamoyladenosine(37)-C(2))-methylthiotransferase [Candidatus Bilamarchaeum sp.]|nr:tRNA (N(6)-L-threonylcarbamoyladenosine(37)-C(2))-methylthiotransferase [Candidatus Bilamarchaeum sp.]
MKVYIETYGCTLNQADSDIMKALLKEKHQLVESEGESDVIILNTCTVKGATENKILARMRSLKDSGRKFVVAGCMTANEGKLRRIAPDSPLLGTSSLKWVGEAVEESFAGKGTIRKVYESKDALPKLLTAPIMRVPINDGCLSSCHFCQTKLARPFLRSYSPKTIAKWVGEGVRAGAKEIQLTSMDSGAYGADIKTNLVSLLECLAGDDSDSGPAPESEFFVRLGMINPDHAKRLLPGLVRALDNKKFYKFLHIPVQSGSEKVCREMNRDHSVEDFLSIVETVRREIPEASIATDIIVGYPTETEEDYQETLELLRKAKPEVTNVSRFSPRPGTKAKEMRQIPNAEIKRRSGETFTLVRRISEERRRMLVGRRYRVLVTEKDKDFKGRNVNYHQVVLKDFKGRLGDVVDVEVTDANHGSLFAKIV